MDPRDLEHSVHAYFVSLPMLDIWEDSIHQPVLKKVCIFCIGMYNMYIPQYEHLYMSKQHILPCLFNLIYVPNMLPHENPKD